MTRAEVEQELGQLLSDVFNVSAEHAARVQSLFELEEWDSLNQVRFVVAIENEFDIAVLPSETRQLSNFQKTVDMIYAKIQ